MINRGQVFVRGLNREGKYDSLDVLDLDDESFRRFVLDMMVRSGMLVTFVPEDEPEHVPYRERETPPVCPPERGGE